MRAFFKRLSTFDMSGATARGHWSSETGPRSTRKRWRPSLGTTGGGAPRASHMADVAPSDEGDGGAGSSSSRRSPLALDTDVVVGRGPQGKLAGA